MSRASPLVLANLGALVAIVFIYVPVVFAKKRSEDLYDYGFHFEPVVKGALYAAGTTALVLPIFTVGFVIFYDIVCSPDASQLIARIAPPGMCRTWRGWEGMRLPPMDFDLAKMAVFQLIVVALPEELFFRGFVHKLLEERWAPKKRILGGGVGLALIVSSALFAVVHMMVLVDPRRLAVFFPGLVFGWLRSATGSIFASVVFHTVCNVYIDNIQKMFF